MSGAVLLERVLAELPRESLVPAGWILDQLGDDNTPSETIPKLADCTVAALSRYIQRGPSTIREWLARGEFPGAYKLGREWRIPEADISAFTERQRSDRDVRLSGRRPADIGAWRRKRETLT